MERRKAPLQTSTEGRPYGPCRPHRFRPDSWHARGGRARLPRHSLCLRFRPPHRPVAWDGVREVLTYGPAPLQGNEPFTQTGLALSAMSEGCLFLNVWTPATDNARRPVLVWLYGGAFLFGAGSRPLYNGARLAARGDVVVVTLNYRLGLFGFLMGSSASLGSS
jgi:carboxylesterase type B